MSKQTVRTGPQDDDSQDTELDYEDFFRITHRGPFLWVGAGRAYIGPTKVTFLGATFDLNLYVDGTYDIAVDNAAVASIIATGTEAVNQLSLFTIVITNHRITSSTDIRIAQSKGGTGIGVNTQENGAPVDTPATTIDFNEGVIATGGAGTTQVNVDWEDDNPQPVAAVGNPGVGNDEVSRKDHAHEGVHSVSANGGTQRTGDIDLIDTATVGVNDLGGGQFSFDALSCGEKPWDYHDITATEFFSAPNNYLGNNGSPAQRCMTLLSDGRLLILWHDGPTIVNDPPALLQGNLYLTVVHLTDYQRQYHTYTYYLNIIKYVTEDPLNCFPGDMCIVAEEGYSTEMVHILFSTYIGAGNRYVYDAYFSAISLIPPPPVVAPTINLYAEQVNQEDEVSKHVSAAAAPQLTAGEGIVVTWTQIPDVGVWFINSNFYDPTQAAGSRYNTGATAYLENLVSAPDATGNADWSTVETDPLNNDYHCCYTMEAAGSNNLYYSSTANNPTPAQTIWDNVLATAQPINGLGSEPFGSNLVRAPSMVVIEDDILVQARIIVIIENNLTLNHVMCYSFSADIVALYPVPTVLTEDDCDLFDIARNSSTDDLGGCYQLGISNFLVSENPILYVYKYTDVNDIFTQNFQFMLLWQELALLRDITGLPPPISTPFNNTPLRIMISQFEDAIGELYSFNFTPKVHFNAVWQPGPTRDSVTQPAFFPINCAVRNVCHAFWDDVLELYAASMSRVMILKDMPLYLLGYSMP